MRQILVLSEKQFRWRVGSLRLLMTKLREGNSEGFRARDELCISAGVAFALSTAYCFSDSERSSHAAPRVSPVM